ncbi:hypothetical protein K525DRAFT_275730 [Schizophyllum commune Loenen D]|nr:hypothetical protein K525DRAFT_275730 [Schizophyllum commune Loenen D]
MVVSVDHEIEKLENEPWSDQAELELQAIESTLLCPLPRSTAPPATNHAPQDSPCPPVAASSPSLSQQIDDLYDIPWSSSAEEARLYQHTYRQQHTRLRWTQTF